MGLSKKGSLRYVNVPWSAKRLSAELWTEYTTLFIYIVRH